MGSGHWKHTRAVRDLIGGAAIALLFFAAASVCDVFEGLGKLSRTHGAWGLYEYVIALAGMVVGFAFFAGRRWRDLRRELAESERREAVLREAETTYRRLLEHVPAVTYTATRDAVGSTSDISPQVERMFGFTPTEWLADPGLWANQLYPDDRARVLAEYEHACATAAPFQTEYRILRRDGRMIWVRDEATIVYGAHNEPQQMHGVVYDITDRKQAEEALAARTAQLAALRAVSQEMTRELELSALLGLVSRRAAEVVDAPISTIFLWDEGTQRLIPKAWQGLGEWTRAVRLRLGEGTPGTVAEQRQGLIINDYSNWPKAHPLILAHAPITAALAEPLLVQDRLVGVIIVHHTDRERMFTEQERGILTLFAAQAAIAIQHARLYGQIQRHAENLEARVREQTAELDEALRVKAEFLAKMSHELRTPLNAVLGFSELLLDHGPGDLNPKQERYVHQIRTAGNQLLALISDILELSLVEAKEGGLHLESVPLAPLVQELLDRAGIQARQKRLELRATLDPALPSVVADRGKLLRVLSNLVDNAVKFTPEGGRITVAERQVAAGSREQAGGRRQPAAVQAEISPLQSEMVEIAVEDTGIGIRAEDLERIFRGFEQVDSSDSRKYGGAGLGLTLVRTLVALHGGRIWAESAGPGQGARFVVRLPRLEAPRPKRILVVEDEAPVLESLCIALERAGNAAEATSTGTQACAALAASPPDLLLLDIGRPDVDGWAILKRVRDEEQTRDLPVLVLTGLEHVHADQALALGADEFLAKPVSPRVLVETVSRLLMHVPREPTSHGQSAMSPDEQR